MNTKTYPDPFTRYCHFLIDVIEGGEVDDPDDKGGHTKYGISQNAYPGLDIGTLTMDDAIELYYRDYWLAANCSRLPSDLAIALFDSRVNHRPKTAGKLLQRTINQVSRTKVSTDGIVGSQTITAAQTIATDKIDEALVQFFSFRAQLYTDIVASNSSQARFLRGWLVRVFRVQQFILGQRT